eukprot:6282074-Pyramimonas_sp.AAC.1
MPVCDACSCRNNLSWYTYCKHCEHVLTSSKSIQNHAFSSRVHNVDDTGNGVWKKWGGKWQKAPPGTWNWNAQPSPQCTSDQMQKLVDMDDEQFEAVAIFMSAPQK